MATASCELLHTEAFYCVEQLHQCDTGLTELTHLGYLASDKNSDFVNHAKKCSRKDTDVPYMQEVCHAERLHQCDAGPTELSQQGNLVSDKNSVVITQTNVSARKLT